MIDLNRYYISSTFVGASGGSEGRSGYVPRALSADEFKFLRGDGTWQDVLQPVETLSALNLQTVPLSTVTFTGETKTSTTSVTATDVYVKVIVNDETKYLRLFDVI